MHTITFCSAICRGVHLTRCYCRRQQYLEEIVALKDTISNWEIPKYIDDFEEAKNTESLLIGAGATVAAEIAQ